MNESKRGSVIVDAIRSPLGITDGRLVGIRPDVLLSQVIRGLLIRSPKLPATSIEDIVVGCAFPEGTQGMVLARSAATLAGIPASAAGKVVSRFGGSSLDALHQVDASIRLGDAMVAVAGGVEDMISIPPGGFNPSFHADLAKRRYYLDMGEAAEELAREGNIRRDVQEEYARASHEKARQAWERGDFDGEVLPIQNNGEMVMRDEGPRILDAREMAALPPSFVKDGSITPATSSPPAVGAAGILLTSESVAEAFGLKRRARIVACSVVGVDWSVMGTGALVAVQSVLRKAGLSIDDIDVIELEEEFAAQAIYLMIKGGWPMDRINLHGGSLALGQAWGCAGVRLVTTLINLLEQHRARRGLAAVSIQGGQGMAIIIERIGEKGA